jgi:hypothetical protein
VALAVRLHAPAFAVNQAEPVAPFDLQATFDIGAVAVLMLMFAVQIDAAADAELAVKTQGGRGAIG